MDENEIAARIHGISISDSESSDDSDFDEELLNALRPPPIPLELCPEDIVTVAAFKTVSYKKHKIKIPEVSNKNTNSSFVNKSERKRNTTTAPKNEKNANSKNSKNKKDSNITPQQDVKPQLSPINSENSYTDVVKLKIKDACALQKNDLARSSIGCKNPGRSRAARRKRVKKENADKPNAATQYQTNNPKPSDITSNVSSGSNLHLSNKSKLEEKKEVRFYDNKNSLKKDMLPSTSRKGCEISNVNLEEDRKANIEKPKKTFALDSNTLSKRQRKRIAKKKRASLACDNLVWDAPNNNVNEQMILQCKKPVVPSESKMRISGDHNSIEITMREAKEKTKKKGTSKPNDVLSSSNNPKNDTKEMKLQNKRMAVVQEDRIQVREERMEKVCNASTNETKQVTPSVSSTLTQSIINNNLLSQSQILEDAASDDVINQKNGVTSNKKKTLQSAFLTNNMQGNVMSTDFKNHNGGNNENKKNKKQSNGKFQTAHLQKKKNSFNDVRRKQQEKALQSSVNHKEYKCGGTIIEKIQDVESSTSKDSTVLSSVAHQLHSNRFRNGNKLPTSNTSNHNLNDFGNLLHDIDRFFKNVTADMLLSVSNDIESSIK
ncbi:hypothetical protein ILUMI_06028 [Ignelater luminosus]|uniref:Uncharacterized protein n=1 Tax=Ignelater luminosus TaxID=2038154 RepID=A0A8K0DA18_IGNLU|nr:hypothetical protein ILUMI_06028 [Ignelater luminosus]